MNCILCKSPEVERGYNIEKDRFTGQTVTYYNCQSCQVQFVFPQNWDFLKDLYRKEFREKISWKQHLIYRLPYSKRHEHAFRFLKGLNKGTLLDLGSGEGKFSWLMKLRGWKVLAVEPTKHYAEFSHWVYGLTVKNCFIEELDLSYRFDLVVLSALLEHLPNQVEALINLKKHLAENGRIFVRIPHYQSKWYGSTHLFLHSEKSIGYTFAQAGLEIEKLERYGKEYYILGRNKINGKN